MSEKQIKTGLILYRILSRAYFHLPFLTIYFYSLHYDIRMISFLMAVYGGTIYLYSCLPEKIKITYHFNSRKTLLISEVMKALGLLLLLVGNHILFLVCGQVLSGLGFVVASGSDSKIIYTNLKEAGFQEKSNSYMFLSCLIAGLIGSVLFNKNIRLPFLFSNITTILTMIVCITLLPDDSMTSKTVPYKKKLSIEEKKVVYTYAFTRGIALSFFTGFLPFYLKTGLNLPSYSCIFLLSSYSIAGNLSSNILSKMRKKGMQSKKQIVWLNGFLIVSMLFFFLPNLYSAVIGCLFLGIVAGIARPLCMIKIKNSKNFDYVVGKMEQTYAVINIFILIIGGMLYKRYTITGVLIFLLSIWIGFMVLMTLCGKIIRISSFKLTSLKNS